MFNGDKLVRRKFSNGEGYMKVRIFISQKNIFTLFSKLHINYSIFLSELMVNTQMPYVIHPIFKTVENKNTI